MLQEAIGEVTSEAEFDATGVKFRNKLNDVEHADVGDEDWTAVEEPVVAALRQDAVGFLTGYREGELIRGV